jgi:hypothetical protein
MAGDSSDHVRAAAEQYGVDLGDAAVEEYAAELDSLVTALETLDPTTSDDPPATDVTEGDDQHGRVRLLHDERDVRPRAGRQPRGRRSDPRWLLERERCGRRRGNARRRAGQ